MQDLLMMTAVGLLAGMLGGLLGVGGGVILMPVLRFGVGLSAPYAIGTCVAAVFCTAFGGSFAHYRLGHVPVRAIVPVVVSGAVSASICSLLFVLLTPRSHWLDIGIATVFSLVALRMVLDGAHLLRVKKGEDLSTTAGVGKFTSRKIALGIISGVLPGLFGIGTGAILVPGFTYLLRTSIQVAIGSALACFALNALLSMIFKGTQGYIDFSVALPICLGTLGGSQLGAAMSRRFSSAALKILFGVVFLWVSTRFYLAAWEVMK
ncbi:MAG: sulfite exporter TauE/SafE family protein [Lentisphaerae bacterium]|nr:sulfite exporter TauE/SafE family protein [Lentisphaerota bacterium]